MHYSNELYHHGRLNQKWGIRNGPPYPLSKSAVRSVYGKNGKQTKEMTEEERIAEKNRIVIEGTPKEVLEYSDLMTNQELINSLNRIKWKSELSRMDQSTVEKGWNEIDKVMNKVGNVKNWLALGVGLYEVIDKASKIAKK